jgi:uncharacterized protein
MKHERDGAAGGLGQEAASARLLVFAKAPIAGRVKTRLAAGIGAQRAAALYERLLRRTVAVADAAAPGRVELWCTPDTVHPVFPELARRYRVSLFQQSGDDLGARMERALAQSLAKGLAAVLIGSDCPDYSPQYLRYAATELAAGADIVLGPVADGGYALVGLRSGCSGMFQDIGWGSSQVMAQTRARLQQLGRSWIELPVVRDIDILEDLAVLREFSEFSDLLPDSTAIQRP